MNTSAPKRGSLWIRKDKRKAEKVVRVIDVKYGSVRYADVSTKEQGYTYLSNWKRRYAPHTPLAAQVAPTPAPVEKAA